MTKELIIEHLNGLASYCDRITTGNVSHNIANLKHALLNLAHLIETKGIDGCYTQKEE